MGTIDDMFEEVGRFFKEDFPEISTLKITSPEKKKILLVRKRIDGKKYGSYTSKTSITSKYDSILNGHVFELNVGFDKDY